MRCRRRKSASRFTLADKALMEKIATKLIKKSLIAYETQVRQEFQCCLMSILTDSV